VRRKPWLLSKRHEQEEILGKIGRLNPILEVITASPSRINKILIQHASGKPKIQEILVSARENRIPVSFVPKKHLDRIERTNQGAIAFVTPKDYVGIDDIFDSAKTPFLVLLDGIEDPQNFGAIIRTAECAGADGIIFPERRSAGLTETVSVVSAGAMEHISLCRVKNLARTMDLLRKKDIWMIGAEEGDHGNWYEFDFTLPVALVFGSEGKGLRPLVREKCDQILSLPLLGRISSLNVAAAASVFFYEVVRQRTIGRNE